MNLPGLGLDELDDTENQDLVNSQIKVDLHNVSEKSEWRFEVAANRSISVKVSCLRTFILYVADRKYSY